MPAPSLSRATVWLLDFAVSGAVHSSVRGPRFPPRPPWASAIGTRLAAIIRTLRIARLRRANKRTDPEAEAAGRFLKIVVSADGAGLSQAGAVAPGLGGFPVCLIDERGEDVPDAQIVADLVEGAEAFVELVGVAPAQLFECPDSQA